MDFIEERCVRPSPSLRTAAAIRENPLNAFERLSLAENYDSERISDTEIHMSAPGLWCDYDISITWNSATEQVQLFLVFEGRIPGGRTDEICRLMSLINERLPAGHFEFWSKNAALVYRNTLTLSGGARLQTEQAMDMIAQSLDAASRGYPASQYVIWAGKSPEDALTTALVDIAANP